MLQHSLKRLPVDPHTANNSSTRYAHYCCFSELLTIFVSLDSGVCHTLSMNCGLIIGPPGSLTSRKRHHTLLALDGKILASPLKRGLLSKDKSKVLLIAFSHRIDIFREAPCICFDGTSRQTKVGCSDILRSICLWTQDDETVHL